jgi:hypothetical protein
MPMQAAAHSVKDESEPIARREIDELFERGIGKGLAAGEFICLNPCFLRVSDSSKVSVVPQALSS